MDAAARRPGQWRMGGARIDPLGLLGIAVLIGLWWALTLVVSQTSLPTPKDVVARIVTDFQSALGLEIYGLEKTGLLGNLLFTVENVLVALAVGVVAGTAIGLASARLDVIRAIVSPLVATAGTVPILIAAPFFLIWFGVGRFASVLLVIVYTTVILIVFSQRAAENLDPVYEDSASTLGASRRRAFWDVLVPATIPAVLGGIRIALAGAWGLEAIAELLGLGSGIGAVIELYATQFETEGILSAIVLLSLVAVFLDGVLVLASKWILRWRPASG